MARRSDAGRSPWRRGGAILAFAALLAMALPARSPAQAIEELVIAQGSDSFSLDPDVYQSGDASNLYRHIFDTLVRVDRRGNLIPHVAQSWRYENDTTLVFALRRNVKFQDGAPLTAADVVFTYERMLNPRRNSRDKFRFEPWIQAMTAPDPFTVRIVTKYPFAPALENMAGFHIVAKHDVERRGDRAYGLQPLGSGPYRVVRWEKDQALQLERHNEYWGGGGAVPFPKLRFVVIPDGFTRTTALLSGNVHLIRPLPVPMVGQVTASRTARVETVASCRIMFLQFPHRNSRPANTPEIDNKKVRQALNYAIDRKAIADKVAQKFVQLAPGPWTAGHWAYPANAARRQYPYDPAKAKQLLREAGFANGFTLHLGAPSGRYLMDKELVEATVPFFEAVGIKVNFQALEWSSFVPTREKGGFSLYYLGLSEGCLDPHGVLGTYMTSKGRAFSFYGTDPELEKIIDAGSQIIDRQQRRAYYQQKVFPAVLDTAPWIFLWSMVDSYAVSNRIVWTPRSDELIDVREMRVRP